MKTEKSLLLSLFTLAIVVLIWGCTKSSTDTSSLYTPTTSDVTAKATLQELQQGRTLYINNCNACHALYSPDSFTPAQWKSILSTMAPKTSMGTADIQLVTKYVSRGNQ